MEIYKKLPTDIQNKFFIYFTHSTAKIIKDHNSMHGQLMEDLRDFPSSLKKLYSLPFAKDHDGAYGRARLLNSLWVEAHRLFGDYYIIWRRMYRVRCTKTAKWWISWRYATNCHKFQINSLWALFTKKERTYFLKHHQSRP